MIFWIILLLFITLILFVMPLQPTYYEWRKKSQALVRHLLSDHLNLGLEAAEKQREIAKKLLANWESERQQQQINYNSKMSNGGYFYVVNALAHNKLLNFTALKNQRNTIVVSSQNLSFPNNIFFQGLIYSKNDLLLGNNNKFYRLISEKNIHLPYKANIIEYVYSQAVITISAWANIQGALFAGQMIQLQACCSFYYLDAPRIEFGQISSSLPTSLSQTQRKAFIDLGRKVISDDYVMVTNTYQYHHFLIKGKLSIEKSCTIVGNIKAYDTIVVDKYNKINGALISEKNITLREACMIQGPIIAKGTLQIAKHCIIGSPDNPATVIADQIIIETGAIIHGMVCAKQKGTYVSSIHS